MKKIITLLVLVSFYNLQAQSCEDAYDAASYGYSHTKKSLEANNMEHMKYYAERAVKSYEEVKTISESCGCTKAYNSAYDGLDLLQQAIDSEEFNPGRFFIKKMKEMGQDIISDLEDCMSDNPEDDLSDVTDNLKAQEDALLAQQQKLLEQQRLLMEKMEKQKQLQLEVKQQKQLELKDQLALKSKVEPALRNFENAVGQLVDALSCDEAFQILSDYTRTQEQLENESLEVSKALYAKKAKEIAQKALDKLETCRKSSMQN